MQDYRPYVTDIPRLWANGQKGYPKGALWTNGKVLYSYGLLIGDTLNGRKRLYAYTRGDGNGDQYQSMTTSQHVGMCRDWADDIMVWNSERWVKEEHYKVYTGDEYQTMLIVERDAPEVVVIRRGDIEVTVTIYEKEPHEGHVRISTGSGSIARTYPLRLIE